MSFGTSSPALENHHWQGHFSLGDESGHTAGGTQYGTGAVGRNLPWCNGRRMQHRNREVHALPPSTRSPESTRGCNIPQQLMLDLWGQVDFPARTSTFPHSLSFSPHPALRPDRNSHVGQIAGEGYPNKYWRSRRGPQWKRQLSSRTSQ